MDKKLNAVCDFAALLRKLDGPAAEVLYNELQSLDCVTQARLSCSALRDFIDRSARVLRLHLDRHSRYLWTAQQPSSLARWPQCTEIFVILHPNNVFRVGDGHDEEERRDNDDAILAVQCLASQPLDSLQRIQKLTLARYPQSQRTSFPVEALCTLVSLPLHSLRHLDLRLMPVDAAGQELVIRGLAALPLLEALRLPSWDALQHLTPLAGRLRRLEASISGKCDKRVTADGIAVVASCSQLQELILYGDGEDSSDAYELWDPTVALGRPPNEDFLLQLLDVLPTAIFRVQLVNYDLSGTGACVVDLELRFQAGSLTSVSLGFDDCRSWPTLFTLSAVVESVLLRARALGPQLQTLLLPGLGVPKSGRLLGGARLERLRAFLLERCVEVKLTVIGFGPGASIPAGLQIVDLVGQPGRVCLRYVADAMVRFSRHRPSRTAPPSGARAAAAGAAAVTVGSHDSASSVPSASGSPTGLPTSGPSLMSLALQRMVAEAGESDTDSPLLVLQGPFLRLLLQTPSAFLTWLTWLCRRAEPQALQADPSLLRERSSGIVEAVQMLPAEGAALLACRPRTRPAVLAAARQAAASPASSLFASSSSSSAAAASVSPAASSASSPAAGAAAAAAPAGYGAGLQVYPVAGAWGLDRGDGGCAAEDLLMVCVRVMQQALQDSWGSSTPPSCVGGGGGGIAGGGDSDNGAGGSGSTGGGRGASSAADFVRRMEQLLFLAERVKELPDTQERDYP